MCGIAGLVDFSGRPDEPMLKAMEKALVHRGPDEGGLFQSEHCWLVHRRLRIIDLSPAAAQPMANENRRTWVVFNGEIYNFHSLRKELIGLGHHFCSRSDTEVLLHGYESWGLHLMRRLRGMFAFALWDDEAQRLVLGRDRVGKKPLFYRLVGKRLVFGSELKVFKAIADRPLQLSQAAFRQYIEYGYVHSPGTLLENVQRLPAGHYAIYDRDGLQLQAYWSLASEPGTRVPGDASRAAAALESTLREAVVCRLESDVPLGCFLSGGVDSSLVAALAQENLGSRLKTYTVGFEDSGMSEAGPARAVAQHLGTDHHEIPVSASSVLNDFEGILAGAAEPIGDDSYVPTHLISRETRRHVTVALSGDGGDELFAGYEKYRQFARALRLQVLPLPWALLARGPWNDRVWKSLAALATPSRLELARWLSTLWKRAELPGLVCSAVGAAPGADAFEISWNKRPRFPELEQWMLTDMETYLEGDILTKVDRASMAASLEARSPFLDSEVIEQTLQWPCHAHLHGGGKAILKTLLAKRLPEQLFARPKQGFGMPVDQWFRGPLRGLLERYTAPRRLRRRGLLCSEVVRRAVEQHLSGRRNFARRLYAVVAFEIWADVFFGEETALA